MSYVFDSSALIYLGKVKLLEKIGELKGEKFVPGKVYEEVVNKGFERRDPEAGYIKECIKKKSFVVKKGLVRDVVRGIPFLSEADKEVLSLAKERNSIAIIDEIYASEIAETLGIESHGSIYLLLKLLEEKTITKKEAVNYLDKMVNLGFYLSIEKYREVLNLIGKMA